MTRVLVCGGRAYPNRARVHAELDALLQADPDLVLMHGACPTGADRWADEWAYTRHVLPLRFPADWSAYGRAAGPIRNGEMLELGRPTLVLAFSGGAGTADMARQARAAGVEVREVG